MFSHITIGSRDLDAASEFYDAVLEPLGLHQRLVEPDGGPLSRCWVGKENRFPRFYVYEPYNRKAASAGNGTMVAFRAPSRAAVRQSYNAAIALGGVDAGGPGPRPRYGKGYFGAYFLDLDRNKIHLVFRDDDI